MQLPCGVGLIKSSIAIELSQYFIYENDDTDSAPSGIIWNDKQYPLVNSSKVMDLVVLERKRILNLK